jgi:hypothetical protein
MSFDWTGYIAVSGNNISDEIPEKVYNNLDILYGDVDADVPSREDDPILENEIITNEVLTDMKDEVVLIDSLNYCRTHYDGHRIVDNATYDVTYDSDYNATEKSDHDSTEYTTHYDTRDNIHYTTRLYSHNLTHDNSDEVSVQTTHDNDENSDHDSGRNTAEKTSVKTVENGAYYGGVQWTNYVPHKVIVYEGAYKPHCVRSGNRIRH